MTAFRQTAHTPPGGGWKAVAILAASMAKARAILPRSGARWWAPKRLTALLSVGLLATAGLAWLADGADDAEEPFRRVERVIDGDTLVLEGGERVRLIGVDTPETVHPQKPVEYFGKEASKFTRGMVEGKRARLEYEQGAPPEGPVRSHAGLRLPGERNATKS